MMPGAKKSRSKNGEKVSGGKVLSVDGEPKRTEMAAEFKIEDTGLEKPKASAPGSKSSGSSEAKALNKKSFPVIGIGASAGGLEALEEFFQNVRKDSGMSYVVISHTDPARSSLLPEIIQRKSNIRVIEVEERMRIEANAIYLPPSNRDLVLEGDFFRLKQQRRGLSPRFPIDMFLKSLADSRGELACSVILSGTGTDGTQGFRVIKEKGGVTVVQSAESAKYEGMPLSALSTGLADFILRPSEMPERLAECFYVGISAPRSEEAHEEDEFLSAISKITTVIRNRTGQDFSAYKKSTITRRIQRRMVITRSLSPEKYLNYLFHNPAEIEALFQELLIGVTGFFRDPEAFDSLKENILASLRASGREHEPFRVWAAGCATGEEVYSIVILIMESLEELGTTRDLQIFGTDLDQRAIEKARNGVYPENIAADVSPARLDHFFEKENGDFRVKKFIREPVVFSVHNILKDPPFSKLDLLVCRNLLIYMEQKAQKKILPLFHYSLKAGGVLFLGSSEAVMGPGDFFVPIDKKWKIYRRVDVSPAPQPIIELPTGATVAQRAIERALMGQTSAEIGDLGIAEATERILLEVHTPPCVVVNLRGEILYIHGHTGKYLEPAPGVMSANVVEMAREGLRFQLASALRKVKSTGETIKKEQLRVKNDGGFQELNLTVKPMGHPEAFKSMIVIIFEETPPAKPKLEKNAKTISDAIADKTIELEREIGRLQQDHRTALEELETSNEELKSVNEELQSSNEELQSTNEELESSREELQSLNEELSTVNAELNDKVQELSKSFETINQILNSTKVAIVFVDRDLKVLRFTREAQQLINLIALDIGRPLSHISVNFDRASFFDDVRRAISEDKILEMDMNTRDGQWYAASIVPYKEQKNEITGAVITFVNITSLVTARKVIKDAGL